MRPESIRRFDLFYLASLALSVLGFFLSYDAVVAGVEAESAAAGLQMGSGLAIGSFIFGIVLYLLLWFLVSRRRVAIARWLIVLLFLINLIGAPALFAGGFTLVKTISLVSLVLSAVAIYYLFQPDTKAWLAGEAPSETAGLAEPD
jgi:hypothetical protein